MLRFVLPQGTNLQALIDSTSGASGSSSSQIVLVISNKAGVQGLERARKAGIQTLVKYPECLHVLTRLKAIPGNCSQPFFAALLQILLNLCHIYLIISYTKMTEFRIMEKVSVEACNSK